MSVEKAAGAGAWSAIDIVLRQVVGFAVSVVLARLLAPEDFGLIALLTLFSSLSIVFVQGGLSLALVQRQTTTHEEESTVFWCNLIAGVFFALVLIAIAPAVARFYGYPALNALMFVAAAQVVLSALGAVHTALLNRTLRFDLLMKTGILSSIVSGVAGVWAAASGWGVWALAVQLLTMAAVGSAALWWVSDWRPAFRLRLGAIGGLYRFGFLISISSTLEVLYAQGFALLVGKLHGAYDLGILNRGAATQALPGGILGAIVARVALPMFAARADDPQALRRGVRMAIGWSTLINLPMTAGLGILSDLVLVCLFGEKWLPAAPILTILSLGGVLLPFHIVNLQLLLGLGQSGTFLKIEIQKKVIGVACVIAGSFFGIIGLAWALLVASVLSLVVNAAPTRRAIGYGILRQLWDVRDIVAATAVMGIVVYLLRPFVPFGPWQTLVVLVAAGASSYLICGLALRLTSFNEALGVVRSMLAKRSARNVARPGAAK